jgi:hypothetical protein
VDVASISALLGGVSAAIAGLLLGAAFSLRTARLERQQRRYDQELSTRTAEAVGQQIGVQPELVTTTTSGPSFTFGRPLSPSEQTNLNDEVAHRVEAAVAELRLVQQAQSEAVEGRVRAIEAKFPDTAEFQKYADANELFLAFQIGEVVKRIDRIEHKQLSRTQVAGIVLVTLVAAVGLTVGLLAIFKAFGVLH